MTAVVDAAKERVLTWLVQRVVERSNKRLDIAALQKQHGAYAGKPIRLDVTDLKRSWQFRVQGGALEFVQGEPVGGFRTDSDTLLAIALGKRKVADPRDGRVYEVDYSPIAAINYGDLEVWGDAASNDALLFAKLLYKDSYAKLKADLQPILKG